MAIKNNKSLGQHWLKNRQILDEIANLAMTKDDGKNLFWGHPQDGEDEASDPTTTGVANVPKKDFSVGEYVVEIGPGLGTLTSSLLKRFKKVIAVEFDENLARNLPKSFPGRNLEVINADFLKFDLSKVEPHYVVAGNIPYYITSPIIEKLLKSENKPQKIVLLIQKEVAERIADTKKRSVLSLFVENYAEVALGPVVKREEFTPPPKVDSQVIVLSPRPYPLIIPQVLDFVKIGFTSPRKKLIQNLTTYKSKEELKKIFASLGISENARPADLSLIDWQNLHEKLQKSDKQAKIKS